MRKLYIVIPHWGNNGLMHRLFTKGMMQSEYEKNLKAKARLATFTSHADAQAYAAHNISHGKAEQPQAVFTVLVDDSLQVPDNSSQFSIDGSSIQRVIRAEHRAYCDLYDDQIPASTEDYPEERGCTIQ